MALDFPSNPVNGQTYNNFYYDGTAGAWRSLGSVYAPNYLKNATFTTTTSAGVPLTIQGVTSQSANLQEWKDSSGATIASITNGGAHTTANYIQNVAANAPYIDFTTANRLIVQSRNSGYVGLIVKGSVSQSANYQEWQDSSGNILASIDSVGRLTSANQTSFRGGSSTYTAGSGIFTSYSTGSSGDVFRYRNIGNNFNTTTGTFTAPIAGRYVVSATYHQSNGTVQRNIAWLYINGTSIGEWTESYGQFDDQPAVGVFYLNANDYVQFATHPSIPYGSVTASIDLLA